MTVEREDSPNAPWCTRAQVLDLPIFSTALAGVDTALLDQFCWVASTWLWRKTGRQFDCPASAVVRPVPRYRGSGAPLGFGRTLGGYSPANFDSRFGTYGLDDRGRAEGAYEVELGHYPVRSIDQVVIDGAVFDPAKYRLDDARWLVRLDGGMWPPGQDWTKDAAVGADRANTWQVSLTFGADPPPDGVLASEVLTGELALSLANSSACRLPGNVASVTRQGENLVMLDPFAMVAGGRWGIREIDMFVSAINPAGLMQRSFVLSPDIPRAVRRTGTTPGS